MRTKVLYTIGHSNRTVDEFIQVLQAYGIELLVDIRRFRTSKWEWFKRENLEAILALKSIQYLHMGNSLGGYRKGGYELYMQSDEYALGIEKLCDLADKKTTAIMCAERLAFKCHRRFVARTMVERGFQVIHVLDGKTSFSLKPLT